MIEWMELCCLLASYEMDEPHTGVYASEAVYYPEITPEEFQNWLDSEHHGDCVKISSPCIKCFAEQIAHKAHFIVDRIHVYD